ncbi:MAG: hypothetical protein HY658_06100 [Actinobacteria bacterium]|nr:hypothetical protein [Actinomycetota bacterium]
MLAIECNRCGRSGWVRPDEVSLLVRPEGCRLFRFTCQSCGLRAERCLAEEELELLVGAGVKPIVVPAEAVEEHGGAPLTLNDLIDLHLLLESPGWEERLAPRRRGSRFAWPRRRVGQRGEPETGRRPETGAPAG